MFMINSVIVVSIFAHLLFLLKFGSSCFIGSPTVKPPPAGTSPAEYNQLPDAVASPSQSDGNGNTITTCGHSQYWNVGEIANVINGVESLENEFPWQVNVQTTTATGEFFCGGVVINALWVLTAAHCVVDASVIEITYGDHRRVQTDPHEFSQFAIQVVQHPLFNQSIFLDYDFAVLKVSPAVDLTTWIVQPVCLPDSCDTSCQEGDLAILTGWGKLSDSTSGLANTLRKAKVPIISVFNCALQQSNWAAFSDRMICAGYESFRVDTCSGDSGGSLAVYKNGYFELCGLPSYGLGCSDIFVLFNKLFDNAHGVYSRVCKVRDWIRTTTGT